MSSSAKTTHFTNSTKSGENPDSLFEREISSENRMFLNYIIENVN